MTNERAAQIRARQAPDDLATKIMTQADPETGERLSPDEMVDQVAIFFLAGHETSAAALGWALYLLASHPGAQDKVLNEVRSMPENPTMSDISGLKFTRNVFRETLRLYPPVPMMVRSNARQETFRNRVIRRGSQIVISPWHLHRNDRYWPNPDSFDPERLETKQGQDATRKAYLPFSSGARACPGAGLAMLEGPLMLALFVRAFRFSIVAGRNPVPVAHLTVRAKDGIWLAVEPRL